MRYRPGQQVSEFQDRTSADCWAGAARLAWGQSVLECAKENELVGLLCLPQAAVTFRIAGVAIGVIWGDGARIIASRAPR